MFWILILSLLGLSITAAYRGINSDELDAGNGVDTCRFCHLHNCFNNGNYNSVAIICCHCRATERQVLASPAGSVNHF